LEEESPYKPDTVKGRVFERKIYFARYFCPFFLANLISVLSEMIPKEIMKRGGILSRLVSFKEDSPYKLEK
jgi:hypothetical protein